ncbi:PH domain-containing protein [Pseudogracilibacillus auburnensis]|uniref:PH domain-containing protein n=1 Tax=Pseudogracilibacillus auburnensis TaxID=1494959 RepID=UPI001A97749E|nr:PH domain-containing protein [Pseudogracilibacillus auburnensis]MBO1001931.1 PH domain-containing protein [Pseudogracilibacillus auburnensis]
MFTDIQTPQKKLSKDIVKVTIISELISNSIGFIVLGVLFYLDDRFSWKDWIGWILIAITVIAILAAVWSTLIRPFLLYKYTRYHVDEEFLQLKTGALNETHELVPMTKIQAVETNQGPIMRKYGLYSISIETMGSSHAISGLQQDVAKELRNKIAHYAKIKEVES